MDTGLCSNFVCVHIKVTGLGKGMKNITHPVPYFTTGHLNLNFIDKLLNSNVNKRLENERDAE